MKKTKGDVGWVTKKDGSRDMRYKMPQVLNSDGSRDMRYGLSEEPKFSSFEKTTSGNSKYYEPNSHAVNGQPGVYQVATGAPGGG